MTFDDRTSFYKELYLFEMDRKDKFNGRLPVPIGIASVLATGILYYLHNFPDQWSPAAYVLAALLTLGALTWLGAVWFLGRALIGHEYGFMPSALAIEDYWQALCQYYEQNPEVEPGLEADFRQFLIAKYTVYADAANRNNRSKAAFLHRAHIGLIAALVLLALAIVPLLLGHPDTEPESFRPASSAEEVHQHG